MNRSNQLPSGWKAVALSELFSFKNGANADGSAYGRGVKFANVLEVLENSHLCAERIPGMVSVGKPIIQTFRLSRGDVLFNRTSETQEDVALASVYMDNAEAIFGGFVIRGQPKSDEVDPVWSGYGLRANRVRRQITALSQGAVRANIGQENLGKVVAWLPPIEEQRAIAGVLSDVDALIESLDALIAKKRDLKQATMQLLLTGKKRLNGFSNDVKLQSMKHLVDFANGKPMEPNIAANGRYDLITLDSIGINGRLKKSHRKVSHYDGSLSKGDIVAVLSDLAHGNLLALSDVIPSDDRYVLNQRMARLRLKCAKNSPEYIRLQLNRNQKHFKNRGQGTSQRHIYKRDFYSLCIPLPDPREQSAIAEVLSDMDAEIDALIARRDKTKLLKTGLMQELLSGRRRLV